VGKVRGDEVLLLWRALSAFRAGPNPPCAPTGRPARSRCPLSQECPRWDGPDDHLASLDEDPASTERRRAAWPCSRLLELLGPDTSRIGR
jgi:hypothetical protein